MRLNLLSILAIVSIALCSCNNEQPEKKGISTTNSDTSAKATESYDNPRYIDTLIVDRIAAVFYQPDSNQIAAAIAADGEDDFYTGEDDAMYYLSEARKHLESVKLKIIDADICKYMKFVYADNSFILIKRDTLKDINGILFFDRVQKPYSPEYLDIDPDYRKYFKK